MINDEFIANVSLSLPVKEYTYIHKYFIYNENPSIFVVFMEL